MRLKMRENVVNRLKSELRKHKERQFARESLFMCAVYKAYMLYVCVCMGLIWISMRVFNLSSISVGKIYTFASSKKRVEDIRFYCA